MKEAATAVPGPVREEGSGFDVEFGADGDSDGRGEGGDERDAELGPRPRPRRRHRGPAPCEAGPCAALARRHGTRCGRGRAASSAWTLEQAASPTWPSCWRRRWRRPPCKWRTPPASSRACAASRARATSRAASSSRPSSASTSSSCGRVAGARSCVAWQIVELGASRSLAYENLKVGRALKGLPVIAGLFRTGELSFSKVRALVNVAVPEGRDGARRHGTRRGRRHRPAPLRRAPLGPRGGLRGR